jgi:hypothetical protein
MHKLTIQDIDNKTISRFCSFHSYGAREIVNLGEVDIFDIVAI